MSGLVEVSGEFIRDTDKAILLKIDDVEHWIPISMLKSGPEPCDWEGGLDCTFEVPEWFALKEGLI